MNLLKVLDALYEEKNVTNVANRLFLSQSAISAALNQLRNIFHDPLFMRKDKSMIPTPLATEIEPLVKETIIFLEKIFIGKYKFIPQESCREFKIGVSEYTQVVFLPSLIDVIRKESKNIRLTAVHFRECAEKNPFDNSIIDVGIGVSRKLPNHIESEILFEEKSVCLAKKGNPYLVEKKFTLEKYKEAPQIVWRSDTFNVQTITDMYLERNNIIRNESMRFSDFLSCLLAIKSNRYLISTLAERLAHKVSKDFGLVYRETPFQCPRATVSAFWPKKSATDPGVAWLLKKVRETAKSHLALR